MYIEKFQTEDWKRVRNHCERMGYKITTNSTKVSEKIFNQTGIVLYPAIIRTYAGKNQLSGGSWSWFMYDCGFRNYGSSCKVKEFLKKNITVSILKDSNLTHLFAESL